MREIGDKINALIEEPVTYVKESNPNDREPHGVMFVVITRLNERKVQAAVRAVDKYAFVVMTDAHEAMGRLSEDSLHRLTRGE